MVGLHLERPVVVACIQFVRDRSVRSFRLQYEVRVDGDVVGRLKRGQTLSIDVEPGKHKVQAIFAAPGGSAVSQKSSTLMEYVVQGGETVVVQVALGPASNPVVTTGSSDDWLLLTVQGAAEAVNTGSHSQRTSPEAVLRLVIATILPVLFVMSLVFRFGSTTGIVSELLLVAGVAFLAYLLYRHLRSAMRSSGNGAASGKR